MVKKEIKTTHKHVKKAIKKHAPRSVVKIKKLFYFKHSKLFLMILCLSAAYYIFNLDFVQSFIIGLEKINYLGSFIAGILIVFGFSAPFSIAYFMVTQPPNLLFATFFGGIGAALGDVLIFKTIKFSLKDEFDELKKTKIVKIIEKAIENNKNILVKHYITYAFVGAIIALPVFPDEIGISLLEGLTTVKIKTLALISFLIHFTAIFLILYLGFVI